MSVPPQGYFKDISNAIVFYPKVSPHLLIGIWLEIHSDGLSDIPCRKSITTRNYLEMVSVLAKNSSVMYSISSRNVHSDITQEIDRIIVATINGVLSGTFRGAKRGTLFLKLVLLELTVSSVI